MSSGSLADKIKTLPTSPGVYFHKNSKGEIIYIGKAANLRNRVKQYFQTSRARDPKTDLLVSEIADVDWTELETEIDALFLEAELIRRYMPSYNILLRDDKSQLYVRIDYKSDYPTVTFSRRPLDDGAEYFGPYLNGYAIKRALRYLRRAFPYAAGRPASRKRASLHYHLGLDPGLEENRTSLEEYRANLRKLMQYLRGQRVALVKHIEKDMRQAAKAKDFERAAVLRNQLLALKSLSKQILFSDQENLDISKDEGLAGLAKILGLKSPPRRIEAYDVSHLQGSDTVASMVVFSNGVPYKTAYRKFKMRVAGNDDFAHINEAISRRFSPVNSKKWPAPDLLIIDGGKGQLTAGLSARDSVNLSNLAVVGLAKQYEEIIVHKSLSIASSNPEDIKITAKKMGARVSESADFLALGLSPNSPALKLIQRIRDESHRFAVAYHTSLRKSRQTKSLLDDIPGVGPATRKKLIKTFGSASAAAKAPRAEIEALLGPKSGGRIFSYFNNHREP